LDAFHSRKRRRLARAINCWRSDHPDADHQLLQVVLALVEPVRLRDIRALVGHSSIELTASVDHCR
jgi:hypothetical protein